MSHHRYYHRPLNSRPTPDTPRPSNSFSGTGTRDGGCGNAYGYAPHPQGTWSTPALLFSDCSPEADDEYDVDDGSGSGSGAGDGSCGGGADLTAAQLRTATAIRIPFLDEDEVKRLHPPAREVHHHRRHQRNRQYQLSSSSSSASRAWAASASISSSSRPDCRADDDDGDIPGHKQLATGDDGDEPFDVDTAVRVSMISLGLGRLENANDQHHPSPLCSNPPREDTIIAASSSLATDTEGMMQQFDEISLGTRRSRPLSQVYDLNLDLATSSASPCPSPSRYSRDTHQEISFVPKPRSPALSPPSVIVVDNDEEDADLAHLQTTLAALLAANTALMTLKAAHEQTIAYHESTILAHKDSIAELSRQLRERDETCPAATKEVEGLKQENAALREERSKFMGRVAELEQASARMEALLRLGGQMGEETGGVKAEDDNDWPLRRVGSSMSSASGSGSTPQCFSSPAAQSPWTGHGGGAVDSPDTLPSSLPSPDSCRLNSMRGFYPASPTPGGRSAYSAIHRRQKVPPPMIGPEDGMVDSVRQMRPDMDQVALEERNAHFQASTASQDTITQGPTNTSMSPSSMFAPLSISELPVLAYSKSSAVWLDRITTIFRYLGLLDFLRGEDHRPDASTSSSAAADWTARRLRAAILLKHAVDDAILEDVLYLHRRRDNQGASASRNNPFHPPPATEDPRRLLTTILTLSRTVPRSPTDLSWIDRIDSSDFEGADGFERFASLVLCVDRRLSLLYGTSAGHYEVLLPRIQECMVRLFPGLGGMTLFGDPESVVPRKRWQLTVWMAKVVRRRRIAGF